PPIPGNPRTQAPSGYLEQVARSCRPSSRSKGSAWPPHRDSFSTKLPLEVSETAKAIMKDRRRQRGVGVSFAKHFRKVLRAARAAGRDDRNPNGVCNGACQFAIEARTHAIAIHRSQQDFARAARFRFPGPGEGIAASRGAPSMRERFPSRAVIATLGVNRHYHCL